MITVDIQRCPEGYLSPSSHQVYCGILHGAGDAGGDSHPDSSFGSRVMVILDSDHAAHYVREGLRLRIRWERVRVSLQATPVRI